MAIKVYRGKSVHTWLPKQASTVFANNSLVALGGIGGTVKPATAVTVNNFGIIRQSVAATDSDYASTNLVEIEVPEVDAELIVNGTGFSSADIGTKVDLIDASNVDGAATAVKVFLITSVVSSTKAIGKLIKAETSNA